MLPFNQTAKLVLHPPDVLCYNNQAKNNSSKWGEIMDGSSCSRSNSLVFLCCQHVDGCIPFIVWFLFLSDTCGLSAHILIIGKPLPCFYNCAASGHVRHKCKYKPAMVFLCPFLHSVCPPVFQHGNPIPEILMSKGGTDQWQWWLKIMERTIW